MLPAAYTSQASLKMAAEGLVETIRQWCSAGADRGVPAGPGQHFARPSRSDGGRIWKYPAAAQSPGVSCPRVAAVVRVLTSAAAVPYLGLIGYNLSRMWDKCHISLLQHAVCHAPSHLPAEREGHHNDYR